MMVVNNAMLQTLTSKLTNYLKDNMSKRTKKNYQSGGFAMRTSESKNRHPQAY